MWLDPDLWSGVVSRQSGVERLLSTFGADLSVVRPSPGHRTDRSEAGAWMQQPAGVTSSTPLTLINTVNETSECILTQTSLQITNANQTAAWIFCGTSSVVNSTFAPPLQEVAGSAAAGERRREEAAHQEAAERLHAVHERGAAQSGRPVQSEGERHHQPDTGPEGQGVCVCVCVCVCVIWFLGSVPISELIHRPVFHIYVDEGSQSATYFFTLHVFLMEAEYFTVQQ